MWMDCTNVPRVRQTARLRVSLQDSCFPIAVGNQSYRTLSLGPHQLGNKIRCFEKRRHGIGLPRSCSPITPCIKHQHIRPTASEDIRPIPRRTGDRFDPQDITRHSSVYVHLSTIVSSIYLSFSQRTAKITCPERNSRLQHRLASYLSCAVPDTWISSSSACNLSNNSLSTAAQA